MDRKRKIAEENRTFHDEWRTKYFFIEVKGKAICLICRECISLLKEYNVKRHYNTKHPNYCSELTIEAKQKKVASLSNNLLAEQNIFKKQNFEDEAAVKASFVIAHKLPEANKPFSVSEFIKDCLVEASGIICPSEQNKFKHLSLSRRTIVRRIENIDENLNQQLKHILHNEIIWYSIALDESVDRTDTAQLLVFIKAITGNFEIIEELLAMQPMKSYTTGADIFEEVKRCWEKFNLPRNKLVSVTTDGAPNLRADLKRTTVARWDTLKVQTVQNRQVCSNAVSQFVNPEINDLKEILTV
ncbi:hypothetical protein CBL_20817 [Carabus blaptoides fortunei]